MTTYHHGVDIDRMPQEWHIDYRKKRAEGIAYTRSQRRYQRSRTAEIRRTTYTRIASLSNVELIEEVGDLGGGDDYDGCFTDQGLMEFRFARRVLRERIRKLEAAAQQEKS